MTTHLNPQDITFILVRPRYPGNIGSAARILKNMNFDKLVVVRPTVLPTHPESIRLAVGAIGLLKEAQVFDTLEEATKGFQFLVGTSRRVGKNRQDFVNLPDIVPKLPSGQKIGILFGAEERGLTNQELALCHLVTTIPSNPKFGSLNLAQSVAVVSYQLRLFFLSLSQEEIDDLPHKKRGVTYASVEQVEGMYTHLEKALGDIGFLIEKNTFHMMRTLRGLFGRTGLTEREVRILRGICRQMLYINALKKDFLKSSVDLVKGPQKPS